MSGRLTGKLIGSRELVRLAFRDPEHVSERLTLYAVDALGGRSQEWARTARDARPDAPPAKMGEELRVQSAKVARIDGAVAGTPFFLALVPGYVGYLWQEARMSLRIAALFGRDPTSLRAAAEMLALRGVHPTADAAEESLRAARDGPPPAKPDTRRPLVTWYRSVYAVLVFGGFLSPPSGPGEKSPGRVRAALGFLFAGVLWAITWILPLTFMIAMAWACESHTRNLGRRALAFYAGEAESTRAAIETAARRTDRGHDKRQIIRSVALALSVAIPIAFVVYANHVRQTVGISWVGALGALVALSLVIAASVVFGRR